MILGISILVGVIIGVILLPLDQFNKRSISERMSYRQHTQQKTTAENKIVGQLLKSARVLKRFIKIKITVEKRNSIQSKLKYANIATYITVDDFYYCKITLAIISFIYFLPQYYAKSDGFYLMLMLLMVLMSFYIPNNWLSGKVKKRKLELRRSIPYVLTLFAVLTEAGLNITQTMVEVANNSTNELTKELRKTNEEIKIGIGYTDALENLAKRIDIEEMNYFISALIQGIEKGSSGLAIVIKEQAKESWDIRKSVAKELAEKASLKLFFPLLGLVLPAMMIFLLGPMIFSMAEMFGAGF